MRSEKASDHGYHWAQPRRHTPGIGVRPRHPPFGDNRQPPFCRIWRNFCKRLILARLKSRAADCWCVRFWDAKHFSR
jgi:hypothetical protein